MSTKTRTTWTCDRCGLTVPTRQNQQPEGWVGVQFYKPSRGGPAGRRLQVCAECAEHPAYDIAKLIEAAAESEDSDG